MPVIGAIAAIAYVQFQLFFILLIYSCSFWDRDLWNQPQNVMLQCWKERKLNYFCSFVKEFLSWLDLTLSIQWDNFTNYFNLFWLFLLSWIIVALGVAWDFFKNIPQIYHQIEEMCVCLCIWRVVEAIYNFLQTRWWRKSLYRNQTRISNTNVNGDKRNK